MGGVIALWLAFLLVLVVDQGAKTLALARAWEGRAPLAGVIRVRLVSSTWMTGQRSTLVIVWALAASASILSFELGPLFQGELASIGLGLALGGAGSNLADRIFRGVVVDFVDLRVWPVFNPADVAIVGGLVLAFVPL